MQNVLNQGGFAGAADARDTHQGLQRELNRHIFEVVLGGTFQNQLGVVVGHQSFEAHANLFSATQVGTGQGVSMAQIFGGAVKNNAATAFTGARPHVDHAVCRQHNGWVVFDHHQGIACIAQAKHGFDDAAHIARVQANAGLVQHEQGIDQRRAQRGGEVDPLNLAARQGAALTIQGQVANADVAQILEPGADLFKK